MDLEPATIDQVKRGKDGKFITIDNDVGGIVKQIRDINPDLHVRFSELGEYFVVYYRDPLTNDEHLLTTAQELDGRLVKRVARVTSGNYDYLAELARLDSAAAAEKNARIKEQIGDSAERLAHALRKDLGIWKDSARSKRSWGKGLIGYGNN